MEVRKFTLIRDIYLHLILMKEYIKINTKTFFEYKTSAIIQIVSMFLNDIIWIIFWALFFMRFSIIKGWTFQDFALLYSLAATSYGVVAVFFGARKDIPEIVFEGRLDYYLTLPKNVLFHLLISKTSWFGLGDLIFGIACATLLLNPSQYS